MLVEGGEEMRQADVEVVVPPANDRVMRNYFGKSKNTDWVKNAVILS